MAADPPVQRDIPYVSHGHPRQTLDIHLPAASFARPVPLLVWIHGGAWKGGSKDAITCRYLLDEGFAIASIGYRFSQDAVFPAQIEDCNAALNFLFENAARFGIDPSRVIVGGGSAGGHLALLLGLARDQKEWGANPGHEIRAILDFFGVSDIATATKGITDPGLLVEIASIYHQLFGGPPGETRALSESASPTRYVTAGAPRILFIHGDKDPIVPLDQSRELLGQLRKFRTTDEILILEGAGHDGPEFQVPRVQKKVRAFAKDAIR